MNNELIERTSRAIASCKGDAPILKAVLLDCRKEIERLTKALEAKPVGEAVAFRANVDGVWFVASTHKFMKATLEKSDVTAEIHPLYTAPPPSQAVQALIDQAIKDHDDKNLLIKSVNMRTQAQPYLDELIAEIESIVKCAETVTDGDTGDTIYIGEAYPEDDINEILDKWRTK